MTLVVTLAITTVDLRLVSPLVCGSHPYPYGSLTYRFFIITILFFRMIVNSFNLFLSTFKDELIGLQFVGKWF